MYENNKPPCRIVVLISGRGSNMLALVRAVQTGVISDATIALVISDKADAAGLKVAAEQNIETLVIERGRRTRHEHDREIIGTLAERQIDLVCLAGYTRLLSKGFIDHFRNRILNIHPSLLPAFPGLHAQRQALDYGVKWSGCTVHFVDETLDGGVIINQIVVPVFSNDTEETLSERILAEEHLLYPKAVARIIKGDYQIQGRRLVYPDRPQVRRFVMKGNDNRPQST